MQWTLFYGRFSNNVNHRINAIMSTEPLGFTTSESACQDTIRSLHGVFVGTLLHNLK